MKVPLKHLATLKFWVMYDDLPPEIRKLANRNYHQLTIDPKHPSLHFKNIGQNRWSVRIGRDFRALALEHDKVFTWVWIGSHAEYDRLIR